MTDKDPLPECILIMSGGLDSAVCAAYAKEHYSTVHALTVSYGQRNPREIDSAFNIATALKLQVHEPIQTAYKVLVGSSLIEFDKIPQYESMDDFKKCQDERRKKGDDKSDPTFVPGRNPFFFNIAVNRAYKLGITDILMGVSASDSDFPDCNKDFLQNEMAPFYSFAVTGNRDTFRCVLPLIDLTKAQVVLKAKELLGDRFEEIIELTHTCYFPSRGGCGEKKCRACLFREQAFKEVGIKDPLSKFRKSPTRQEASALTPLAEELLTQDLTQDLLAQELLAQEGEVSPQEPSPQEPSPQEPSIPELSTQEG